MVARKPARKAVAVAIRPPDGSSRVLLVRRPPDDPDLPGVWGLPAVRIRPGESDVLAAQRIGPAKLGCRLRVGRPLGTGSVERERYRLDMRVFEAELADGEPAVPQPDPAVTQYAAWRWGPHEALRPAADRGSLCAALFLRATGSSA